MLGCLCPREHSSFPLPCRAGALSLLLAVSPFLVASGGGTSGTARGQSQHILDPARQAPPPSYPKGQGLLSVLAELRDLGEILHRSPGRSWPTPGT